jgi:sugar phosphate isomerase/epimerase
MKNIAIWSLIIILTSTASIAQKRFSKILKLTPGLCSYSFRNEFSKDVAATLDKTKAMGIINIEFSNLFGKTAKEMRIMLDERGMICTSYGVSYEAIQNKPDDIIREAKELGAAFIRVAWITHKPPFTIETTKQAIEVFHTFGKKAKENGITFCYHNHGYEFATYEDGTLFDYLIKNTNPEYVSFEMDILWIVHPGGDDPVKYLKKYPKRFKLMHVKDLKKGVIGDLTGKTPPENDVTLGTGQINLKAILKAAQKTDIKHFYIEDENPNAMQQVPLSMAYLKALK